LAEKPLGIVWTIQKRAIKDLKPFPKNPRSISGHDAKHLQQKLEKYGLIDKPVITKDGMIIGGHQRITLLKKMGHKEVDCEVPDRELSEEDIEDLNLGLNRVHGDFDYDILANQFEIERLIKAGFKEEELAIGNVDDITSEEPSKGKKKKSCPNYGHEF